MWRRYRDWFAVLVFVSVLTGYTLWYLHLNPQHVPLFLTSTMIALGFVAVMALLPRHRQRLVKGILAYHARGKEVGGWPYRYRKAALILSIICTLTLPIVSQYGLIPSQYMPFFVLTLFTVILASGAVLIGWLFKIAGKWGLLLIAVVIGIAVLRLLIRIEKSI